ADPAQPLPPGPGRAGTDPGHGHHRPLGQRMIQLPPPNTANASLLPDLTPLLDVIFIVLVFFLLTAQVPLLQRPLDLPQDQRDSASMVTSDAERQLLELDAAGRWRLDDRPLSLSGLPEALSNVTHPALD